MLLDHEVRSCSTVIFFLVLAFNIVCRILVALYQTCELWVPVATSHNLVDRMGARQTPGIEPMTARQLKQFLNDFIFFQRTDGSPVSCPHVSHHHHHVVVPGRLRQPDCLLQRGLQLSYKLYFERDQSIVTPDLASQWCLNWWSVCI